MDPKKLTRLLLALFVVACGVIVYLVVWHDGSRPVDPKTSTVAIWLKGAGIPRSVPPSVRLEVGTVVRISDSQLSILARKDQAYEDHRKINPPPAQFDESELSFQDSYDWETDVSLNLPGLGDIANLTSSLKGDGSTTIESTLSGISFPQCSEADIAAAGLKPEYRAKLGRAGNPGDGVFVVLKACRAERLTYRFKTRSGAVGKAGLEALGKRFNGQVKYDGEHGGSITFAPIVIGFADLYFERDASSLSEDAKARLVNSLETVDAEIRPREDRIGVVVPAEGALAAAVIVDQALEQQLTENWLFQTEVALAAAHEVRDKLTPPFTAMTMTAWAEDPTQEQLHQLFEFLQHAREREDALTGKVAWALQRQGALSRDQEQQVDRLAKLIGRSVSVDEVRTSPARVVRMAAASDLDEAISLATRIAAIEQSLELLEKFQN